MVDTENNVKVFRVGSNSEPPQDAQKGRPARPQQAKRRGVLSVVRGAPERRENAAGGLFQHPVKGNRCH